MGHKIVTVAVTILMLIMCIIAGIALSTMISHNESRENKDILNTLAVDISDEITEESTVRVTGAQLITSMLGTYDIDNDIPNTKEQVYTSNTGARKYSYNMAISDIDASRDYKLTYRNKSGHIITDFTGTDEIYIEITAD